jgi:hypothetical protein
MKLSTSVGMIVIFATVIIIAGPLITLWMLNTLFATGLEYSFMNWLAALVLNLMIGANRISKKD